MLKHRVESWLSRYIKGVGNTVEGLKVSIWNGEFELSDAELRVEALNALLLPLRVNKAVVKALTVSIPWTQLLKESVTVKACGVWVDAVIERGVSVCVCVCVFTLMCVYG